jgi:hypothetical protein
MDKLYVFGARAYLVNKIVSSLENKDIVKMSSSIQPKKQGFLLDKNGLVQLKKEVESGNQIICIFSSSTSRKYQFNQEIAVFQLNLLSKLFELATKYKNNFKLIIFGSVEALFSSPYDGYRSVQVSEWELFLTYINKSNSHYFLIPTVTPSRFMGRMLRINSERVAKRFLDSMQNLGTPKVYVYKNLKYKLIYLFKLKMPKALIGYW